MEVNANGLVRNIEGIAWRLKNKIVDELRMLKNGDYHVSEEDGVLENLIEQLTGDAEELEFIGDIIAGCTDKKEK
jgi:hypothetical protein